MLEQAGSNDVVRGLEENDVKPNNLSPFRFRTDSPFRTPMRPNTFVAISTWTSNRARPITQRKNADAGLEKSS